MVSVLIVDDDEKIVRMLIRRLKKRGYDIHVAVNGKIGVEKVLELQPDLTLLDMHMPVMNGYEAVRTLREQGYQGLVVALTASAMAHQSPKALEAGCNHFISKPIDPNFEEQIENLMQEFRGCN